MAQKPNQITNFLFPKHLPLVDFALTSEVFELKNMNKNLNATNSRHSMKWTTSAALITIQLI